ncbi:MAG: hypothetical protein KBD56_01555 [Candidatus Eisenbacteria bacterium]|nr:hypothetical protein [Candidatus Eisenbacteria bacterium]
MLRKIEREVEIAAAFLLLALLLVSLVLPGAPGTSESPRDVSPRHPLGVDGFGRDNLVRLLIALRNTILGPACGAIIVALLGIPLGIAMALWRGPLEGIVLHLRAVTDVVPRVLFFFLVVVRIPALDHRIPAFALLSLLFVPSLALGIRNAVFGAFSRSQIRSLLSLPARRREIGLREVLWLGCRKEAADAVLARFVELVALESVLACFGRFSGEGASLGSLLMPPYTDSRSSAIALALLFLVVYLPLRVGAEARFTRKFTAQGRRSVQRADLPG